jgi:hypothetical protein
MSSKTRCSYFVQMNLQDIQNSSDALGSLVADHGLEMSAGCRERRELTRIIHRTSIFQFPLIVC